jgi:dienelactone hydrolase
MPSRRGEPAAAESEGGRVVVRRQRLLALGLLVLVLAAVVTVTAITLGGGSVGGPRAGGAAGRPRAVGKSSTPRAARPSKAPPGRFAVGLRVLHLSDTTRTVMLPDGRTEPRRLLTYVRYPALGASTATDIPDAPAASADGPFPLVVFGHGFDVTPSLYRLLLQNWARAGYVVAAPAFPRENADAPGGPDESDLPNQPADMSFVITEVLAASAAGSGALSGLVDPHRIAVTGQSDGGDAALAAAYDRRFRDRRIDAAVILSGAEIPSEGSFAFPAGGPPLLATQGTVDTINRPGETEAFFLAAHRPKYLLRLLGAGHLPPYSTEQPQLGIVERVTTAFLDGYLKHRRSALERLSSLGSVSGTSSLLAEP